MIRVLVKDHSGNVSCNVVPYLSYNDDDSTLWWQEDYDGCITVYEMEFNRVLAEVMLHQALECGFVDLTPYGVAFEVE